MKDNPPNNFAGLLAKFSDYRKSSIVILPVPFDKTSTWLKGADNGPQAIIEASCNLELYDIETGSEIYKKGICTEKPVLASNSKTMINRVYENVKGLLGDEKYVVTLGGEHSVSLGAIKAHSEFADKMSVLHLDAHTDMRDTYENNRYSHACVMKRVRESIKNTVSVGIRSMDYSELKHIPGNRIIYAEEVHYKKNWINTVLRKLSKKVYITIDVDVFDPGIMPSTGTPEPGGLDWYQVIKLLRSVSKNKNIVGFDVVELCPSHNKAPDFLAAKLIYKLLSYKFFN